jgi:hypothetical protein
VHLLAHWLGLDDPGGAVYLAWSGVIGDLGYLAILGGLITIVRRHNCHEPRCWRIGRILVDDKGTLSCWHHYPGEKPQRGYVHRRYHLYLGKQPGHG